MPRVHHTSTLHAAPAVTPPIRGRLTRHRKQRARGDRTIRHERRGLGADARHVCYIYITLCILSSTHAFTAASPIDANAGRVTHNANATSRTPMVCHQQRVNGVHPRRVNSACTTHEVSAVCTHNASRQRRVHPPTPQWRVHDVFAPAPHPRRVSGVHPPRVNSACTHNASRQRRVHPTYASTARARRVSSVHPTRRRRHGVPHLRVNGVHPQHVNGVCTPPMTCQPRVVRDIVL
jgi:hypothetical protein